MSEIGNQCTERFAIFEQTQVSLNSDFLTLIPTSVDQASFFVEIAEELQLTFCEQIDNGCLVFLGIWNNIMKAEKKLQECLRLWEKERDLDDGKTAEDMREVSILIPEGYVPSVLPGGSHLYLVPRDSGQPQRPQLLPGSQAPDKRKQKFPKTQGDSGLKELYVDIAVNSAKKNQSSKDFEFKISSEDQNPLDKLCQLLCIDEDETIEKSLSLAEKRRSYEENLPFKYFCDKCSFKAKRENHLVKHLKLHDEKKVVFCCEQCDFRTICERSLSRHKVTHSTTKLTCNLCSFVTDTKNSLLKHTQAKHGPNYAKTVKCRHCDFLATKPREMFRHLKLLHPKQSELTQTWKCSKCPYSSKLRAHLNRHMNDVHDCVRKFLCHYCGKNFKRSDTLTAHKATHGELSRTFPCQHCSKVFVKPVHLQQHLAKHSSERPFLCDMCGKSYKTMQATKRHKHFMHSESVRMWPCPRNCERTFKYRTHLNKHLKQQCKHSQRLKTEAMHVPEVICGASVQEEEEEDITPPITIQVVYTEQLEPNNQNVNIK